MRILLVEDEPEMGAAIKEILNQEKYIRPLAKVANDRHNLAQIARNCRYQQLN
jgi:DNA-binding response OmpR family regulator